MDSRRRPQPGQRRSLAKPKRAGNVPGQPCSPAAPALAGPQPHSPTQTVAAPTSGDAPRMRQGFVGSAEAAHQHPNEGLVKKALATQAELAD